MNDCVTYKDFYIAVLAAGSIFAGFSAVFLQFRLQREAGYYRQPAVLIREFAGSDAEWHRLEDRDERGVAHHGTERADGTRYVTFGTDVLIGLSHFGASFLMLCLAVLLAFIFGFAVPLLALSNALPVLPQVTVGGLIAAMIFLIGYFVTEMYHYRILPNALASDANEWSPELLFGFTLTFVAAVAWGLLTAGLVHIEIPKC